MEKVSRLCLLHTYLITQPQPRCPPPPHCPRVSLPPRPSACRAPCDLASRFPRARSPCFPSRPNSGPSAERAARTWWSARATARAWIATHPRTRRSSPSWGKCFNGTVIQPPNERAPYPLERVLSEDFEESKLFPSMIVYRKQSTDPCPYLPPQGPASTSASRACTRTSPRSATTFTRFPRARSSKICRATGGAPRAARRRVSLKTWERKSRVSSRTRGTASARTA